MRGEPTGQPPKGQLPWGWIAAHGLGAGAFFFTLNMFVVRAGLETSLLWGAVGVVGATWLAINQARRRG